MPPKKDVKKGGGPAPGQMVEEDLTDVATLPQLNEFVFINLYSFKYKQNQKRVDTMLLKEFKVPEEGETAELAKRQKVIQQSDLLVQVRGKQYLTDEELNDLSIVDPVKVQQAFARATAEILAAYQIPMRRAKAEVEEADAEAFEQMSEAGQKTAMDAKKAKKQDVELTVWLKDFPRTASDFKELRRSAAQHQPQLEVAIHGVNLIEEQFVVDYDEVDEPPPGVPSSILSEHDEDENQQKPPEFTKDERTQGFKDMMYFNKYAKNCPYNSSQRLMTAQKFKFKGPDPPRVEEEKEEAPVEEDPKAKAPKKKGKEEEVVQEVEKSPEQIAEDKMFNDFVAEFKEQVRQNAEDMVEYKQLSDPIYGVDKVPLWPKALNVEEEARKLQEAKDLKKKQEEEEAERKKKEEEEAAKASAPQKGKAAAAKKPPPSKDSNRKPGTREGLTSSRSARSGASRAATEDVQRKLKEEALKSQDDLPKNWSWENFDRVVSNMKSADTNVGSLLAAMVYQIEEDAKEREAMEAGVYDMDEKSKATGTVQGSQMRINKHANSSGMLSNVSSVKQLDDQKQGLVHELEDIFGKLTMEHAVVETGFKHHFSNKAIQSSQSSPYQVMYNECDELKLINDSFTFMNGRPQGHYETATLNKMQLPGINSRFDMPKKETRVQCERESDTAAILKYCMMPTHQTKRQICLKAFEHLLQRENPEREYSFLDRNFTEEFAPHEFRQVMTQALRLLPDVNTAYFDKEDALLVALNFKNPPGRLLRRQWSYPVKALPDFSSWKQYIKEGHLEIADKLIDIPAHKIGLLRKNSKFCFPCDNSVIRIDKVHAAAKRTGTSVITKDNLTFGIKETQEAVDEKVQGQDEIPNLETRKQIDRRCAFWMEFENGTRMHIEMLDKSESEASMIPPLNNDVYSEQQNPDGQVRISNELRSDGDQSAADKEKEEMNASGGIGILKQPTNFNDTATSGIKENQELASQKDSEHQDKVDVSNLEQKEKALEQTIKVDNSEPYHEEVGASMIFTYKEGLVVQVLPNGDIKQQIVQNTELSMKASIVNNTTDVVSEVSRIVTRSGAVIRHLKDGNTILYFPDGTITTTDHRRGLWRTTNPQGVIRVRNVRQQYVNDEVARLEIHQKIDPETNAAVEVREDGLLKVTYADRTTLLVFPDKTQMLIKKSNADEEESRVITTLVTKEGYSPVRLIDDPVKRRSGTIIGLGGADALMGKDNIMERSNNGIISETLLPDRSVLQTYLEKQELPGYNRFSTSLIHFLRRDDFSIIKVRQDGEVVVITSNERAYLNSIGKELEFGVADYDYFFELFGVPIERRSGVYTANLEQGRIWTQDEEGNFFMIYANGDSTEKLSVSFNLDQMVEGIDNKEPNSPRIRDGEFIEEECKFLPPPKTVAHPRLFLVKENGAKEFYNGEQLEYLFRCKRKDGEVIRSEKQIKIDNEKAISHHFMRKVRPFDAANPSHLDSNTFPKLPAALAMINQTVSIPSEPITERFCWRNIFEFEQVTEQQTDNFHEALEQKDALRETQAKSSQKMKIETRMLPEDQQTRQCKIWLRIARARGKDVESLLGDEFKPIKLMHRADLRQKVLDTLDEYYAPGNNQD